MCEPLAAEHPWRMSKAHSLRDCVALPILGRFLQPRAFVPAVHLIILPLDRGLRIFMEHRFPN